jgi:hypothetical protein
MAHYDDMDECTGSMNGGPCKNSGGSGAFMRKRRWQKSAKISNDSRDISVWGFK